jgi:hypothetical protein
MVSIAGVQVDQLAESTCARRAARAVEIVGWWEAVEAGQWYGSGYRSPSAWIAAATRESVGDRTRMLLLGQRLSPMPVVAELFRYGLISEHALGLIADAWHDTITDAFERDEVPLADWATKRPVPKPRA